MLPSKRPYLLSAWYDWIIENDLSPHIIVDATYPTAVVPQDAIENDRITINIAPGAISEPANMRRGALKFEADFGDAIGITSVVIPINAIVAIYPEEYQHEVLLLEETEAEALERKKAVRKQTPMFVAIKEEESAD